MTLCIEDLTIDIGNRRIVSIKKLEVGQGEIVGLVGESGSGKSMTAMAVLGLAGRMGALVQGSIGYGDDPRIELVGASERVLRSVRGRHIAMVFQSPSAAFSPVLRLGVTFIRALRLHGTAADGAPVSLPEARQWAEESLANVMLPPTVLSRYPHQLSGGQLQRVAIALGLALGARLLIADEPTSALDVTVQAEILDLLRELRDTEGLGMLFISHDLAVIAELADRVAVMRAGRVVEVQPTDQLIRDPRDLYSRELIAAVPRLSSATWRGRSGA